MEFPVARDAIDKGLVSGFLAPDEDGGYTLTDLGRETLDRWFRALKEGGEDVRIVEAA